MTQEIVTVENVRGYCDQNGTVYLNAEDVARGLGFTEPKNGVEYVKWSRVNRYLLDFGFSTQVSKDSFIPENMFYRLAMKASNETAQKFQAKIADEILPAIRKHGFYATPAKVEEIVRNPEIFIEHLITAYQRVKTERDELQLQVADLKPKASYCDKILQSGEALPVTVIAKDYGMSAVTFNQLLRELKIQYKVGNAWVLYQLYAGLGYTKSITTQLRNGLTVTTSYWTQKGRMFVYGALKKSGILPTCERENSMATLL